MFVTAQKQALTQKQLTVFMRENTLLADEATELLVELYQ